MRRRPKLIALTVLAASAALAQMGSKTLQVTDPAEMKSLTRLNERIDALSKQVMVCVEKKLAQPEKCFCNYPLELAALRKEHQAVLRAYPSWSNRAVSWVDSASGSPLGHTIAIANLGPQLASCSSK
jgi:hypothetical protein